MGNGQGPGRSGRQGVAARPLPRAAGPAPRGARPRRPQRRCPVLRHGRSQEHADRAGECRADRHPGAQCRRARSSSARRHQARRLRPPRRYRPVGGPCPGPARGARHDRAGLGSADPGDLDCRRVGGARRLVLHRRQGGTGGPGARAGRRTWGHGHHLQRPLARLLRHRDQCRDEGLAGGRTPARALPCQALGRAVGNRRRRRLPRLALRLLRQWTHAHRRWRGVGHLPRLMESLASTRDVPSQLIVAAILVGVFALLAADRVHRVLVPIGAVALIWLITYFTPFRLISFQAAQQAIDLNVILLLFAMMALVGVLKTTNVFPWAVDRLLERSRGNPSRAARSIIWFTGTLSAVLDNVTTVIFTYPMASEMARRLKINASAFFLPMVMAANIGGTATLIGDPPNVLIGADPRTGLSFMDFIYHLTVPCTFMMIVLTWYARRYYPADIGRAADADHASAAMPTGARLENVALLRVTCWITALIFAGFMTHTLTHMPVAVPAVIGIAAILFAQDYYYLKAHQPTPEERQHGVLAILEKDIEWPTLAFFIFLFVLVGAAVASGLIESLAHGLALVIDAFSDGFGLSPTATLLVAALLVLWVSGFLSAVIDNIPYTAVTIPLVASLLGRLDAGPDGQVLWWALALGACLGGNGTLIGASANVTVTGLAEKDGKRISFNEFTAFGSRVAGLTLLMSSVYLALWLYIGSTVVNLAGAVVLVVLFAVHRRPATGSTRR